MLWRPIGRRGAERYVVCRVYQTAGSSVGGDSGDCGLALNAPLEKSDEAYPWLLSNLLPVGVKGIAFAALTAAIVSSLASMMNSISTIFTMDIYRSYFRKDAGQQELVLTGRWASFGSLLIAVSIAPMLSGLDQAFQYIQEFDRLYQSGGIGYFPGGVLL